MNPERNPEARSAFEQKWRVRFEEYARLFDDDAGIAGWSATGLDARLRRFLGLWQPAAVGERWLDAGCGAGTYTRILLQHGLDVVGVDYSWPTVQKAATRGLDSVLAVADVSRLPFRPGVFHGVICFGVTQALSDSRAAVQELGGRVRPGGELWLDALNRWCLVHAYELLRRWVRGHSLHLRYESPRRLRRLLQDAGFDKVRVHWMPILPTRWYGLQGLMETRVVDATLRLVPLLGMLISHAFIVRAEKPPVSPSRASSSA
jgi:SAM-dependent methyltransferase